MHRRISEHRGRTAARLSTLAGIAALVVSTMAVVAAPAEASNSRSTDRSCRDVNGAARPRPHCPSGPAGGAMGSAIDTTALAETLLSSVAKSAGSKIGGELAGWALASIFGTSQTPTEGLADQLNGLQKQMTDLKTDVRDLNRNLKESLDALMTEQEKHTYDLAAAFVNADAAALADYQVQLDSWLRESPGSPVDGSQSSELLTMRSTLGVIIQHINDAMVGSGSGKGLIAMYSSVLHRTTPYPTDRFYTSDFTTPMSDMLDYYQTLMVQAFTMLAEVNHLSWTINGVPFPAKNGVVATYADLVPTMLTHWSELATRGVGRLPDHVVADTTTGLMWSRSNLTLGGGKVFCWAFCGTPSISSLLTPATVIEGLAGWGVPSGAQLTALTAGHENNAFGFLTSQGFQWQQTGGTVGVNGVQITVPSYWTAGGTSVDFAIGGALRLHDQNYWPTFLPGPGAVAVRPLP